MLVIRPWGSFQTLYSTDGYQVKQLIIKPDQRLSLQYHLKRSEHWVVVEGMPQIQIGDDEFFLSKNQSAFIPKGVKHRISNYGKSDAIIIECQIGSYLGEDDIVRLEDDYNRYK